MITIIYFIFRKYWEGNYFEEFEWIRGYQTS